MDPRLAQLQKVRDLKKDVAEADFRQAYQTFLRVARACEIATQRRDTFQRDANAITRQELDAATGAVMTSADVLAIHDGSTRRAAAFARLQADVVRLAAERERVRAIALEKQKIMLQARKSVEKLGNLREKLRDQEISLQNRLSESFADSVVRDLVSGKWKLRQMD